MLFIGRLRAEGDRITLHLTCEILLRLDRELAQAPGGTREQEVDACPQQGSGGGARSRAVIA